MFPLREGLRGMANSFLQKVVSSQSTSTLSGWVLTFLCGVVFSQSVSIERLSQQFSSLDRQVQDHGRDDRERDTTVVQMNLEITRLHAADDRFEIAVKALQQHMDDIRAERNSMIVSLTEKVSQARDERIWQVSDLQRQIDEIRHPGGDARGPAPLVDGDTAKRPQR